MDQLREIFVRQRLRADRRGSAGAWKWHSTCSSNEMGERPVSYVVQQTGQPKGLHDQTLGRGAWPGSAAAPSRRAQARVQMAGPEPGLVHHTEAVREAAVLAWEDPSSALVEAYAPHPLQPCRIEQIAFGRLLRRKPEPSARSGVSRLVSSM